MTSCAKSVLHPRVSARFRNDSSDFGSQRIVVRERPGYTADDGASFELCCIVSVDDLMLITSSITFSLFLLGL
jgi:hypothetical protein